MLHLLEDYESSSSDSPRDVNVINVTETSASAAARTPTQQLRNLDAILRESPFDPVLNPDVNQWAARLQETGTISIARSRTQRLNFYRMIHHEETVNQLTGTQKRKTLLENVLPVLNRHGQPEIQLHRVVRIATFANIWTTGGGKDEIGTTLIVIGVVLPLDEKRTPLTVDTATVSPHAKEGTMIEEAALTKIEIGRPVATAETTTITTIVTMVTTISEIREPMVKFRATASVARRRRWTGTQFPISRI